MSRKLFLLMILTVSGSALADNNIFLGKDNKYQISISGGKSIRDGSTENLYTAFISYSEPGRFFRLQAKNNLEFGGFKGLGSDNCSSKYKGVSCQQYDQLILGISKDVALLHFSGFYSGVGLGAYIKSKSRDDTRVNSGFLFGERVFLGWNFNSFNTEVFIRHFSNGTLTDRNHGYNFVGAAFSYNF